ncbi:MAG: hypothetical protein JW739_06590 [Opitutales bacterium]|nr:hypothetical protein [Opitutales bacterium]
MTKKQIDRKRIWVARWRPVLTDDIESLRETSLSELLPSLRIAWADVF